MSEKTENIAQTLDEKFQRMEVLIESFLRTVYEWDALDPLEVALFLQLLTGKQLDTVMQAHLDLHPDHVESVAKRQVDTYSTTGTVDQTSFIGEVIGLHAVTGTKMMKMYMMLKDMNAVAKVMQDADDIPTDE